MARIVLKRVGDWSKVNALLKSLPKNLHRAANTALKQEAHHLRKLIIERIDSQVPPPNAETTIALKGSSKTLVNHGDLRNSVNVVDQGDAKVFIGVPRTASNGRYNLAKIMEEGRIIVMRMTAKQQRFLFMLYAQNGIGSRRKTADDSGIIVIHIPARPFITPVLAAEAPQIPDRIYSRMVTELRILGTSVGTP